MNREQRQAYLESRMVAQTRERFEAQLQKAEEKGRGVEFTEAGRNLINRLLSPLADLLGRFTIDRPAWCLSPAAPPPCDRCDEVLPVSIDAWACAWIVAKTVLNTLVSGPATYTALSLGIGRAFESELRERSIFLEGALAPWSNMACHAVGVWALHCCEQHGMLHDQRILQPQRHPGEPTKRPLMIDLDPTFAALSADFIERSLDLFGPDYTLMVVPPRPWTDIQHGGYHHGQHSLTFIIRPDEHNRPEDAKISPLVYDAVNAMQATPWKINLKVLEIIEAYVYPFKREVRTVIEVAQFHRDDPELFFPHHLDFTGRAYPVPQPLNIYGSDVSKSLLTFATGKPIVTQEAEDWLAVHGANCYGGRIKRQSFKRRVEWVQKHEARILEIAADPWSRSTWLEGRDAAGDPWQFLAFCFEWDQYRKEGFGFVSHLPVVLDGTCNGLQHYSAILRDDVTGRGVNLLPTEQPKDLYLDVAEAAWRRLKQPFVSVRRQDAARTWLAAFPEPNRKLCKGPVMVLPYGGAWSTFQDEIDEYLKEKNVTKLDAGFMASVINLMMKRPLRSAVTLMRWLKKMAKGVGPRPLTWTTPAGFTVWQAYPVMKQQRIRTLVHGETVRLQVFNPTGAICVKLPKGQHGHTQSKGFAPNFIHSLDASHMMLTVNAARAKGGGATPSEGITSFAMIHDCYGTHAADTEELSRLTRETFSKMYEEHDVLKELTGALQERYPDLTVPLMPALGKLDIHVTADARYLFM